MRAYLVRAFWTGLYRADDTAIVVLTMHSNLFYNDDCPQDSWAIILVKGGWLVPSAGMLRSQTMQLSVYLAYQRLGLCA